MRISKRRGLTGTALVAALISLAGCGQASATSHTPSRHSHRYAQLRVIGASPSAIPVTGGTPAQQAAVTSILNNLGSGDPITSVMISSSGPAGVGNADESWLTVTLPSATPVASIRAQWLAYLLAGSFRDNSTATSLPAVGGLVLPGTGAEMLGGSDHPQITADASVAPTLSTRLADLGVSSPTIALVEPNGSGGTVGVSVVGTVSDPAAFLAQNGNPEPALFGDINQYEGVFLQLDDPQGAPFLVAAYASRAAHGIGWIRPSLGTNSIHG
jgi:hypothetical protein